MKSGRVKGGGKEVNDSWRERKREEEGESQNGKGKLNERKIGGKMGERDERGGGERMRRKERKEGESEHMM